MNSKCTSFHMTADVQHSEDMLPHCHGCRLTPAAASDAASKEKGGKNTESKGRAFERSLTSSAKEVFTLVGCIMELDTSKRHGQSCWDNLTNSNKIQAESYG